MSVTHILCPKCGYLQCYCKCAPEVEFCGVPVHRVAEWQWAVRPPWWRPFRRRRYDRKLAEGGIGYYTAHLNPADLARLPPMVLLYRRPTAWELLKRKLFSFKKEEAK